MAGMVLGWSSLGALAIRSPAVKRDEIGRLRVRELIVEQQHEQEV